MRKSVPVLLILSGLILISLMSSCSDQLEKEIVSRWPDESIQKIYYFRQTGGVREKVAEERYYQNGQKEYYGEFKNGQKDGLWTYWYDNGRKWSEGHFKNGLRTGESTVWHKNGFKNYEGVYSKGKPHGTWTFYDTDGSRNKDVMLEYGHPVDEKIYKESAPRNLDLPDSVQFKIH